MFAIGLLSRLFEVEGSYTYHYKLGVKAEKSGQVSVAKRELEKSIDINPRDYRPNLMLAKINYCLYRGMYSQYKDKEGNSEYIINCFNHINDSFKKAPNNDEVNKFVIYIVTSEFNSYLLFLDNKIKIK